MKGLFPPKLLLFLINKEFSSVALLVIFIPSVIGLLANSVMTQPGIALMHYGKTFMQLLSTLDSVWKKIGMYSFSQTDLKKVLMAI